MNHRTGESIFIASVYGDDHEDDDDGDDHEDVDDGDGSDGAGGQCGPTEG